jgi:pimeloyl-ACP methyl ester carboxylesterase
MKHVDRLPAFAPVRGLATAALLSMSTAVTFADEVQIQNDGKTLVANLELAENASVADGVVLIIHALMQHYDTEIIRGLQNGLQAAGRSSLAINLSLGMDGRRGSFACTMPITARFDDSVAEGDAWIEWLRAQGARDITLMGHSSGANEALGLAIEHPAADVSALVLLSPMTTGHERVASAYEKRWRVKLDDVLVQAKSLIDQGQGDEFMRADFTICPQARVTARAFVDWYGGQPLRYDPRSYLRRAVLPIQIIVGSDDERQPNVVSFLEPYVDDEKVFMYTIQSGGHFFRDLNLDEAIEVTVEFLDGIEQQQIADANR